MVVPIPVPPPVGDALGRVLIVDDSAVARAVMARAIDATDRFAVVGSVATVAAARTFLARHRVEFILLDIQLPETDGLTALPDLLAAAQGARVVVVSSSASEGAATTVRALALGAADTLEKPTGGERSAHFGPALIEKLMRLAEPVAEIPVARAASTPVMPIARRVAADALAEAASATSDAYDIVAIGASTGGIHALSQLLRAVPAGFRVPILVTQHLPASFMPYFAAQLAVLAGRPCDVATDRMRIRPGRIVIAPGHAHMRVIRLSEGGAAIRLIDDSQVSGCMPSVDPMLASLADAFGPRVLGIMLSGMGRDGLDGAQALHRAGGCIVAQDRASSVVWGMPGAVASAGIAAALLPPDAIGRLVASRKAP